MQSIAFFCLCKMLNKKEFAQIRKELSNIDEKREQVIQLSREIIGVSKQIIYEVQRNDMENASSLMAKIRKDVINLKKANAANIQLDTNINSVAFQEYVEAACFYDFKKVGRVPSKSTLGVSTEDYLMGLCDLTGELVRKAVQAVIHKNFDEAHKIKDLVNEIYGEFLKFNLRNSELRKKSDSIKWNLKKLEEVVYDVEMKRSH